MSAMGIQIDKFDVPVCNSFQAKIFKDQLCYEVDLKRFSREDNIKRELKLGLNLLLDYNEDRQIILDDNLDIDEEEIISVANSVVESDQDQHAIMYLNTIGKRHLLKVVLCPEWPCFMFQSLLI